MNDLFRFIMLRPPGVPPKGSVVRISLSQKLHDKFVDIPTSGIATRARELQARGTGLIKTAADLKYGTQYPEFLAKLESIPASQITGALGELVNQTFGKNPQSLVADKGFVTDKALTSDTLIVAKLASNGNGFDIAVLNAALRAIAVIESAAAGVTTPFIRPTFVVPILPLGTQPQKAAAGTQPQKAAAGTQPQKAAAAPPPPPPEPADQSDDDPGTVGLPSMPTKPAGIVTPVGIADLLVVKQRLKRYEGGDVAHIENVLRTESFHRDTRRLDRTQTTVTTETDVTTEEERDTQSTDRFSLQRECANTIKQDASLKAGVAMTASYGPTVTIKANVDAATSTSKEDSTKQATSYSQDVTSRTASKIIQTTKQLQTMLTSSEYQEDLHHGFDNTDGNGNVSGVYQWVNKVYEAQVYNYGQRLMFDVMIPEPAAFLISQMKQAKTKQAPEKPQPFTTPPSEMTDKTYQGFAQPYGTTNLDPPPDTTAVVAKEFDLAETGPNLVATKSAEITVPTGYQAEEIDWVVNITGGEQTQGSERCVVNVGSYSSTYGAGGGKPFGEHFQVKNMNGEIGTLPITMIVADVRGYTLAVTLTCGRTERAYQAWQEQVHAAIMLDYQRLLADYEKAVRDAADSQGVTIQGQNPVLNRAVEQKELKKACITLITGQHYESFGAVELSTTGQYPEVLLANVEEQGKYARFFEQAFEWEQMMYIFYPYYWGRKSRWPLHVLATDPDPLFSEFLNAGFARVVFPVRLNWDQAVLHYLESPNGELWEGGDLPTVTSPLYHNIVVELQEQQGAPGDEIPQGPPWEVTLPTTLVKLRSEDKLPSWHWDNSTPAQWIEVG